MQIIIPMSGIGKRFIDAGYTVHKALIDVDGMPIIEHVVNMFPGEKNITFICNQEHLDSTNMNTILKRVAPTAKIIGIPPHKKGPVYAVSQIFDSIDDLDEVIVNYCDFGKYWDYNQFLQHTRDRNADGAISAYKGFHPHMLGTTNYAFMRSEKQWLLEIREKQPFTDNRLEEYASDGTYYFKSGALVKKYFSQLLSEDIQTNGEYYVSMIYNLLLKDTLKVSIYEIQHMLQWGTPDDLMQYNKWSEYFKSIIENKKTKQYYYDNCLTLIPLAGRGNRFAAEGYKEPKPLIDVSGKPMIIQASEYLPATGKHTFVCLGEHLDSYTLENTIKLHYQKARIVRVDTVTEGQACTCELGLSQEDLQNPLQIGACDNGMLWSDNKFNDLMVDKSIDAIVWTFRNHPSSRSNPQMYGWVKIDNNKVATGVSVKKAISNDPYNDHAIVGAFTFKKAAFFLEALQSLYSRNIRVNGEFYVDSCMDELIKLGKRVAVFEIDHYLCWGTPNDLRTFRYWQSFFHKAHFHPYALEKDHTIQKNSIQALETTYSTFSQSYK